MHEATKKYCSDYIFIERKLSKSKWWNLWQIMKNSPKCDWGNLVISYVSTGICIAQIIYSFRKDNIYVFIKDDWWKHSLNFCYRLSTVYLKWFLHSIQVQNNNCRWFKFTFIHIRTPHQPFLSLFAHKGLWNTFLDLFWSFWNVSLYDNLIAISELFRK